MLYTEQNVRENLRNRDGKRVFFLGKNDPQRPLFAALVRLNCGGLAKRSEDFGFALPEEQKEPVGQGRKRGRGGRLKGFSPRRKRGKHQKNQAEQQADSAFHRDRSFHGLYLYYMERKRWCKRISVQRCDMSTELSAERAKGSISSARSAPRSAGAAAQS